MIVRRLVSLEIGAGKIHIAIEVSVDNTPAPEYICASHDGLKGFAHVVGVPNSKLYGGAASICRGLLVQLRRNQQCAQIAPCVYQESIVRVINELFL